ncbi:MAG: hypothetical protein ACK41W_00055 [Cyanobacteriota bacterium]|jgi:hypothetical protein
MRLFIMNVLALLQKMRSTGVAAASTRRLAEESSSFSVVCESWVRLFLGKGSDLIRRPVVRGVVAAGIVGAGIAIELLQPPPAEAQKNGSLITVITCKYTPPFSDPYNCPHFQNYTVDRINFYADWGRPFGSFNLSSFSYSFAYDPSVLVFRKTMTSLLCELRAPGVAPYCPTVAPGQGSTTPIVSTDSFSIDQTGLTITEDPTGLPSVRIDYSSPTPIAIAGERNFLALAFDLVAPLPAGMTVTYSPSLLPGSTFATTAFGCTDASGSDVECDSAQPSLSLRLTPTVPGPVALATIPAMLHARRRLRRRIRGAVV